MNRLRIIQQHISPSSSSHEQQPISHSSCSSNKEEIFLPMKIAGLGRALPEYIIDSATVDVMCGKPIGFTQRTSGVARRRWVQSAQHLAIRRNGACVSEQFMNSIDNKLVESLNDSDIVDVIDLSAKATIEALEEANIKGTDLSFIIYASATPERSIPDGSPLLQQRLGLGESGIPGTSIHSTCLSFLVALNIGSQMLPNLARQNPKRKPYVLIASADAASCGLNFTNNAHSAGLMGDAATAVIITLPDKDDVTSGIVKYSFAMYGGGAEYTTIRSGGSKKHPSFRTTTVDDLMFMMNGRAVLEFTAERAYHFLQKFHPGLVEGQVDDITAIIPHQASKAGMSLMADAFGWPEHKLVQTLEEFGNCVSVSLPLTLYEAIKVKKVLKRGDTALLAGTGAGLNIGALLLNY
jgi:3-oxoacyl-[acyl-carrier-protein] synthase-3